MEVYSCGKKGIGFPPRPALLRSTISPQIWPFRTVEGAGKLSPIKQEWFVGNVEGLSIELAADPEPGIPTGIVRDVWSTYPDLGRLRILLWIWSYRDFS